MADVNLTDPNRPFVEPPCNIGEVHTVEVDGIFFEAYYTGDSGMHTARDRFHVACRTCSEVLHHNTTGPAGRIRYHMYEKHGGKLGG